jgi:hypothetical protein
VLILLAMIAMTTAASLDRGVFEALSDLWGAISFLWNTTVHAIVAWCIVGSIMTLVLYKLLKPGISRLPFKSSAME